VGERLREIWSRPRLEKAGFSCLTALIQYDRLLLHIDDSISASCSTQGRAARSKRTLAESVRGSERGGKRERPLNKVTDVDGLG